MSVKCLNYDEYYSYLLATSFKNISNVTFLSLENCNYTIVCDDASYSELCSNGGIASSNSLELVNLTNITMSSYDNSVAACYSEKTDAINCQDYHDCQSSKTLDTSDIENGAPVCCTGYYSCEYATNITGSKAEDYDNVAVRCDACGACYYLKGAMMTKSDYYNNSGGNIFITAYVAGATSSSSNAGNIVETVQINYNSSSFWLSDDLNSINFSRFDADISATGNNALQYQMIQNGRNLYCMALYACESAKWIKNFNNIWIYGINAASGATIDNIGNDIYCGSYQACKAAMISNVAGAVVGIGYESLLSSTITNADEVVCRGDESCKEITVREVNKLIASGGTNILSSATIVSNQNGGETIIRINGSNDDIVSIYCNATDTCKIDCQSAQSCVKVYLYCFGDCFVNCDNDNGIICPFVGIYDIWTITTTQPSLQPTQLPNNSFANQTTNTMSLATTIGTNLVTNNNSIDLTRNSYNVTLSRSDSVLSDKNSEKYKNFAKTIEWIDNNTIYFGLGLLFVSLIFVVLSWLSYQNPTKYACLLYKEKNEDETTRSRTNEMSVNGSISTLSNVRIIETPGMSILDTVYVPRKPQHFVFLHCAFTLYDLFTDIAFAMYLYYLSLFEDFAVCLVLFVAYVLSLVISYSFNIYTVTRLFNLEFAKVRKISAAKSKKNAALTTGTVTPLSDFGIWFEKYAARNASLKVVYFFAMLNIELFDMLDCQVFNYPLFCAPLSFKTIQHLKQSTFWSIMYENGPQLFIQFIVFVSGLNTNNDNNVIVISSMVVALVEVILMLINVFVWKAAHPSPIQMHARYEKGIDVDDGYVQLFRRDSRLDDPDDYM